MKQIIWLALAYNVPIHPSKNRVYVWRKLKEMGAGYFKQGVAILPKTPQSMTQFTNLASKIKDMNGEASMAEMRFCDPEDELNMINWFKHQSEDEYLELIRDCTGLISDVSLLKTNPELFKKLRKRYSKVKSRDYFKSRLRSRVSGPLEDLAQDMANVTDEIAKQIKGIFEL